MWHLLLIMEKTMIAAGFVVLKMKRTLLLSAAFHCGRMSSPGWTWQSWRRYGHSDQFFATSKIGWLVIPWWTFSGLQQSEDCSSDHSASHSPCGPPAQLRHGDWLRRQWSAWHTGPGPCFPQHCASLILIAQDKTDHISLGKWNGALLMNLDGFILHPDFAHASVLPTAAVCGNTVKIASSTERTENRTITFFF